MASGLRSKASPIVALVPWGDVVEEFLDPLDLTLDDFLDRMSGGWLFGYVAALQSAGWRPMLVCASQAVDRPVRRTHRPSGAPVWLVPGRTSALPYSSKRSLAQWWRMPWRGFAHALRAERCDAVVMQEYEYPRFDTLGLLARALRVPLFATFQGGDRPGSRLEAWARPHALRLAHGLVIASAQERDRVAAAYPHAARPVARIPNPIDTAEWVATDRMAARAALGCPPDAFIAITHGRIDIQRKGLDVLVDAWRAVAAAHAGARLVLIGAGQDNAAFATLLANAGVPRIEWQASYTTDRVALRQWLSAADVYVSTSRLEGMPVAPLEAMACGLPVVASRAQGLPDIFEHGEASGGLLVPCNDAAATAGAIDRLATAPALRAALGAAGRARVEQHFSVPAVGRALTQFMMAPR